MLKNLRNNAENLFYAGLWILIFALVPVVFFSQWVTDNKSYLDFHAVLMMWLGILPFFLLFLFHNWLAAPLLIRQKNIKAYIGNALVFYIVFVVAVFLFNPGPGLSPAPFEHQAPPPPDDLHPAPKRRYDFEILKSIIGLLILGVNLGVKYYAESIRDRQRLQELQAENLKNQLGYLRYQINPHFFMNTLNNIHALVELDPEKAKHTIEEFSKMMRHVLYDGDRPTVSLTQEVDFLRHYISLMQLRYDESVQIILDIPEHLPDTVIPPLTLACFAENAFKHGVSYDEPSQIKISIRDDEDKIVFKCFNSLKADRDKNKSIPQEGGLGLKNVRDRLRLIYGDDFLLHLEEHPTEFDVLLILPLKPSNLPDNGS